jgi:phosphatidylglycerol:prolipoprotein diacylglycerol transferase
MYVLSCGLIWIIFRCLPPLSLAGHPGLSRGESGCLLVWAMVGAIIGGRLGYVFIYEPGYYLAAPAEIFRIWRGGMSFHGGLLGVLLAAALSCGQAKAFFWPFLDRLALLVPLCLALGRLGNFFMGELWGPPSDLPWAVVFPAAGSEPRHPTQLYEALLEGPLLALVLWGLSRLKHKPGFVAAAFAVFYSLGRFVLEFWRLPDPAWGYLAGGWLTVGQLLSAGLFVIGLIFLKRGFKWLKP